MTDKIVLLAVTKMLSGLCVGGISLSTGKWIRPVKECGSILLGDIQYPQVSSPSRPLSDGVERCPTPRHMCMFDVVQFELLKARPCPPHVEDWIADFVRVRPRLIGRLSSKREAFLDRYAEKDTSCLDSAKPGRSLALVGPCRVSGFFRKDPYSGKYEARLGIDNGPLCPVTDLKWRALGRVLTADQNEIHFDAQAIMDKLGTSAIYLSVGLSRLHQGKYWPLIVGVHPVPDYEAEIDYFAL